MMRNTDSTASDDTPHTSDDESRDAVRLGFLIHDVARMRRAAYDQLVKPLNSTRSRSWVMAHLSRYDGMTQVDFANLLNAGRSSVGAVLKQLEVDGLVERRSDPADKRVRRIYLSHRGRAFIEKLNQQEGAFNRYSLMALSATERNELARLLTLIKKTLQPGGYAVP
ncbi:MAG: transcriptional regulator, MarR family [Hydrocarboniphaga sp.]|nr:transcriptional regulator, MarR family [Hydrocarboniphaga sp.]